MGHLEQKTQRLRDLIGQASNSGKIFWSIGENLFSIKKEREYVPSYPSFETYIRKELSINEKKAQGYIEIYHTFKDEDITDLMLISHLRYISKLSTYLRTKLLGSMRKLEEIGSKGNVSQQEEIQFSYDAIKKETIQSSVNSTDKSNPPYIMEDLKSTINIVSRLTKNPEEISQQQFTSILENSIQRRTQIQRLGKIKDKHGEALNSRWFPRLQKLFQYEPINEAGFVALFCTMFHQLQDIKLSFDFDNGKIYFHRIGLVRSAFPDAKIICRSEEKPDEFPELNIEFEFASSRYLSHGHDKDNERCDMIICWIHDFPEKELFTTPLPPILCVKELLDTGKIALH
ncbi:hypothetical protein U27_06280 [Candidatus Vecturithrix granuli]|uniref:Uncharacterized protein n=1 Tax=Vecturithrix granuli TaxID=1499967 RepID=A0A081C3Z8_VECG1|nr:hypothetical protein U27_06280 [Candidatus Vecturithrix granuli]